MDITNPEVKFSLLDDSRNNLAIFGRQVAQARFDGGKSYYARFDLDKRPYIGPTSTDHTLAFLMANQAQLQPGCTVLDPFFGTGSIALALQAQEPNCLVFGSDIDKRVLHGQGVGH